MRFALIGLVFISFECRLCPITAVAAELRPTFRMFEDPLFEFPTPQRQLPPKIVDVWRSALDGADPVFQLAAATDVRKAHRMGFNEVAAAVPELRKLLRDDDADKSVRIAAAQALIELDARNAAGELFDATKKFGSQFRLLVEPALAAWNYRPMRDVWRERFRRPATYRRELLLACDASGRVRDKEALPDLMDFVRSADRPQDIRLAAARAAGEIADDGLEVDARSLLASGTAPLIDRLCAVSLLRRHDSEPARELLVQLFHDPAGPIASAAIRRLFDIDPELVLDLAEKAWAHPDVAVRRVAAQCWISLPTESRLRDLAPHMHDPNPSLRIKVRDALLEFSRQPEFATVVREAGIDVLKSDGWRGQEQAGLLLGQIDYEPAAQRFVELLQSKRPEVAVTSAWALRMIAVTDTLPAMLDQAQRQTDHPQGNNLEAVDQQVSHLFEGMAMMNYRTAIPLMRRHVPKQFSHRVLCRGAAIWGLGFLLKNDNDEDFAAQLMGRINDVATAQPEIDLVREMSAITLGRIKSRTQLDGLKKWTTSGLYHVRMDYALQWAIQQISGETVPILPSQPMVVRDWRLQAVEP